MATVSSHGTSIYYEVHGEGDRTLVFAHGMGGNGAIWFNQVAHFSPDYRVIVFDHRYFGRSHCAVDDFRPAWFPDDALAILDAENISTATFICQSMGGWTGSQLALRHADRVDGLVMSHTPGVFTHASAVNDRRAVIQLVSQRTSSFSTPALAADYPAKNPVGAVLYAEISAFNSIDPAVIPRKIGEAGIDVDTDSIDDYKVPTLFITADHDVLFPPAYIEALAHAVPGAGFANLGDAGHSSYFEIPEVFNARLEQFLA
ncbi:MAG: alpha/beta fold hydrolase [Pseudomonadales bacterium]|nr:alpha/beta fold hydrolase [Pseudomonadales bacterium]